MTCVGIDLLEVSRLERAIGRRPRLAGRLFTSGELELAAARARPARTLAARFCAKEAATKALGLDVFRPLDFEVLSGAGGRPELLLTGEALARADDLGVELSCSLTHAREMAGAVVVAS